MLFAIVFFRLWFLQVLSGEDYVSQARDNRVRKVRIEAPRGDIVDRNGTVLVKTRVAPVVQIVPSSLPESVLEQADEFRKQRGEAEKARLAAADQLRSLERDIRERRGGATRKQRRERRQLARQARQAAPVAVPTVPVGELELRRLYRRLGRVIDVKPKAIHERVIEGIAELPYSNVTIRTAVDRNAFNFIRERKEEFPGVEVEKQYLRDYPYEELGAQLFGTTREISPQELKEKSYRGVEPGTRIGADGIEERYDEYLRGTDGFTRVVINALGSRDDRRRMSRREPRQGKRLRLTLDLNLQRAANDALARAVGAASENGAKAGAFVAMDPRNGEILALGSYPSFDANEFAKPISQERYNELSSEELGAPLFNRAISATYPTGSTFKPVTAMAALEEGIITPSTPIVDDGEFELGDRVFKNARDASYGTLTLPAAMTVSSDVFFYQLGFEMNGRGPVLQEWARRLGVGRRTGIDIPGEFSGLVPDSKWRNEGYKDYLRCAKKSKVEPGTTAALFACGGIERTWSAGDNVNLAVGQGDLQATPLQLATAYSTIINQGRVPRPHLGLRVEDGNGVMLEEIRMPARRRVSFDAGHHRSAVRVRRHRARVVGGRQRQPRRRRGRPAGDAAADGHRLLDDHLGRQGRPPAPRDAGGGRQWRDARGDPHAGAPPRLVR
ncbi:MAG TPA: penicillin-binding transpeptidase domain-containing protein, partial [Solirubrobacteraceae bacterium]